MPVVLGVPTLNRYDLLPRMLASVERCRVPVDRLIVVDNGGQLPCPFSWQPRNVKTTEVIVPGRNLGVAASWNRIIEMAPGADICIVNDDIVFRPDGLRRMLERREPLVIGSSFAAFLWRLGTSLRFDEGFWPGYGEDVDMLLRVKRAGHPFGYVTAAEHHTGGATLALDPSLAPHVAANAERFRRKWGRPWSVDAMRRDWREDGYYRRPWRGRPPPGEPVDPSLATTGTDPKRPRRKGLQSQFG